MIILALVFDYFQKLFLALLKFYGYRKYYSGYICFWAKKWNNFYVNVKAEDISKIKC